MPAHAASYGLLRAGDPPPVGVINPAAPSPFVLVCDHAGNAIPASLGDLGLSAAERNRHIAIDIGALAVAERLAWRLEATLIYQRYSRLVIDCNRLPMVPAAIPEVSDGTVVPGNRRLHPGQTLARIEAIHQPYHQRIEEELKAREQGGRQTIFVAVHSFTPRLRAKPAERPWAVGVCTGEQEAYSRIVYEELCREPGLVVGWDEPYDVNPDNDYSIPRHAEARNLPYVQFEMRQDLLGDGQAAEAWAVRLERVLRASLPRLEAHDHGA